MPPACSGCSAHVLNPCPNFEGNRMIRAAADFVPAVAWGGIMTGMHNHMAASPASLRSYLS